MIICPNCQHEEMMGALVCSNCGAQLVKFSDQSDQENSKNLEIPSVGEQDKTLNHFPNDDDGSIYLQVLTNGKVLPLTGREEYTIGRVHDGQPIIPDIDLNPYGGFEEGVSRLHVSIQAIDKNFTVIDLGSINGTSINGKKIPQHVPHPLAHGDILTLGKMKMKVIIRK